MQDQLSFRAERRGDYVAVVCTGWDHDGEPIHFDIDTSAFLANTQRQVRWAMRAEAANDIYQAFIRAGVAPAQAWQLIESALPPDMRIGTEWQSTSMDQGDADRPDELLEGSDNVSRHVGDGDS